MQVALQVIGHGTGHGHGLHDDSSNINPAMKK
jgi:hypothetical protein